MLKAAVVSLLCLLLLSSCIDRPVSLRLHDMTAAVQKSIGDIAQTTEEHIAENSVFSEPFSLTPLVISFLAAGDNIVYLGNVGEAAKYAVEGSREYNFKHQYNEVSSLIGDSDISFINQETLMTGEGYDLSYYPQFNSPQDMGFDLVDIGFDIVNIANNHMLDWGTHALKKTIDFWRDETEAFVIGDYLNNDEYENIRIYEKQGIKIAFLSYTYGTNRGPGAQYTDVTVPYLKKEDLVRQAAAARKSADLVFVSVHWGDENSFMPNKKQIEYAQLMCDLGVDVIIGHHPHVIQPVVRLENAEGHTTLCAYSLGNFAAEMANDYNMVGGLLTFNIVVEDGMKPYIAEPLFIPTVYFYNKSFRNNRVYFMRDFTEEMAAAHGIKYYGHYTTLQILRSYVTKTIAEEFLPDYMLQK